MVFISHTLETWGGGGSAAYFPHTGDMGVGGSQTLTDCCISHTLETWVMWGSLTVLHRLLYFPHTGDMGDVGTTDSFTQTSVFPTHWRHG